MAISLQLVPIPAHLVSLLSPNTLEVVSKIDARYVAGGPHPLSVLPDVTGHALALFVAFSIFLAGLSRLFAAVGTRWMLIGITVMGVTLAIVGIAQKAIGNGMIYGFWVPHMSGDPFGPFVNRNHFAGWMLMALPLTLGFLCAGISRGLRYVKPALRDRMLWLGSRDASEVILAGAAAIVMGLALVMTMSRSGMSSFVVGVALTSVFVVRGMRARARRSVAGLYLAGLVILVAAWVGVDVIVTRFAAADWTEFNGRLGAWADAWAIGQRFLLAGTGLNTYRTATLLFQQHDLENHYAQAHNDYLQLFAEGGLLLVIPAAVLVLVVGIHVWRRFREDERESPAWWARAGAVTGILSIALQETVEFSLQMPGNAALFVVLWAIAIHRPPSEAGRPRILSSRRADIP